MPAYKSDDIITRYLFSQGIEVKEYTLKNGLVIGGLYHTDKSELAYRYDAEENKVFIAFYKRIIPRKGLKNGFHDFHEFVTICARLNVRYIQGLVSHFYVEDNSMTPERMIRYYERVYNAYHIKKGSNEKWMGLDLDVYRSERQIPLDLLPPQ